MKKEKMSEMQTIVNEMLELVEKLNTGEKRDILNKLEEKNTALFECLDKQESKPEYHLLTKKDLSGDISLLSKAKKYQMMKTLNLTHEELQHFITKQRHKKEIEKKDIYSIYTPNYYGSIANKYCKSWADTIVNKYPEIFTTLLNHFRKVNMPVLSRTYISMMIFYSLLALPALLLFFFAVNVAFQFSAVLVILIALLGTCITLLGFYFYPGSLIEERSRKIRHELPFAIVHMSAVAGSGAHPISMFELIAESDEYTELKKEVKKVLNYVNLFGYDLSTALHATAQTTPSEELRDLLNGIVSSIGTGGSLRIYLEKKAEEALNSYKLEQNKLVELMSTYSDIYTAILIAAPLLLIVTLAIINSIGGEIGGLNAKTIAILGIYGVMPLLNVGFMFFLRMSEQRLT